MKGHTASLGPPHRYPERDEKMGIRPVAEEKCIAYSPHYGIP